MTNKEKQENRPNRRETIYLSLAVRDAYFGFDQEDYCQEAMVRCGNCFGCAQYKNLERAYKIAKRFIPTSSKTNSLK